MGRAIQPSLAIEIDTHQLPLPLPIDMDHITLTVHGKIGESPLVTPVPARADRRNIEDNGIHHFKVVWSGKGTNKLEVYFDYELRLSLIKDIKSDIFTDSEVWWGWTGATGPRRFNEQWIKPIHQCDECREPCEICMDWVKRPSVIPGDYPPFVFFDCDDLKREYINDQTEFYLGQCLAENLDTLSTRYTNNCRNFDDRLVISDTLGYHHFTLFYYDRAGNLVRTVPPEGVDLLSDDDTDLVEEHRKNTAITPHYPEHRLVSTYEYNSIKQVIKQNTPDGNTARFWYNAIGHQVLAQDAEQATSNKYSYMRYDALGRIIETGELDGFTPTFEDTEEQIIEALWENIHFPDASAGVATEITRTEYGSPAIPVEYEPGKQQTNLRNRISHGWRDEDGVALAADDRFDMWYSYDPHGNVDWFIQEIPGLGQKKIRYEYDLVSGNVNKVFYQENTPEQFIHRYEYDEDNRILNVFTSKDGLIWDRDVGYEYYLHGAARAY